MFWVFEEVFRRTRLNYASLVEEQDTVGDFTGKTHFVSHTHHCHPAQRQFLHNIQHFFDHLKEPTDVLTEEPTEEVTPIIDPTVGPTEEPTSVEPTVEATSEAG